MQQNEACVRIDVLHPGLVRGIGLPKIQRFEEFRQRIMLLGPRRMILRQQQSRGVGSELTDGDATDIATLLELRDVARNGLLEPDLALLDRLRQQRRDKQLAERSKVEQRI